MDHLFVLCAIDTVSTNQNNHNVVSVQRRQSDGELNDLIIHRLSPKHVQEECESVGDVSKVEHRLANANVDCALDCVSSQPRDKNDDIVAIASDGLFQDDLVTGNITASQSKQLAIKDPPAEVSSFLRPLPPVVIVAVI